MKPQKMNSSDLRRMQSVLFNPAGGRGNKIKTRIICTIGPKSNSVDKMSELLSAGMSIVRMNTAHGDFDFHQSIIDNAREAAQKSRSMCALLLDTKGPEIRTGKLQPNPDRENKKEWVLEKGQEFVFTTDKTFVGNNQKVSTSWENLPKMVSKGTKLLVADGLISFSVLESNSVNEVRCIIDNSGTIGENKNMNVPGTVVDLPAVTQKDKQFIEFGVRNNIEFIAASFIRKAQDIREVRAEPGVKENGIKIIAKIESQEGIDNFDEILAEADGIMVARGDLGVEIPLQKVATAQKMMIMKCNAVGKPVITATQMLESMIVNPRPTRAEVTDIFNAVLDGTDCVMLSGETANGSYPVDCVKTMADVCREAESGIDYRELFLKMRLGIKPPITISESIASSAVKTAWDVCSDVIICLSESGNTARLVAKYRPHCPILCVTPSKQVGNQLLVNRGCYPYVVDPSILTNPDVLVNRAINRAKFDGFVSPGQLVLVVSGVLSGSGNTNMLKVIRVEDV